MSDLYEFTPQTEVEIAMEGLLPKGTYQAEIKESKTKVSSNGNHGINLVLTAYDNETHKESTFFCWLYPKLLKHLCDVTGNDESYKTGKIDPNIFKNLLVTAILDVQTYINNKGESVTKNCVIDFISKDLLTTAPSSAMADDDVPF